MKITYILLPGLGDERAIFSWFYRMVGEWWSRDVVEVRIFKSHWSTSKSYAQKYNELVGEIKAERKKGRAVVLVGVSAGASLAYLAFAQHAQEVQAFISLCGFTRLKPGDFKNPQVMKFSWYQAAAAAERAGAALGAEERSRILAIIPKTDNVINPQQQQIEGAKNVQLKMRGHLAVIMTTLLVRRRMIQRFATSKGSA